MVQRGRCRAAEGLEQLALVARLGVPLHPERPAALVSLDRLDHSVAGPAAHHQPLPEPVDLIIANLPYVSEAGLHRVNTDGFEPLVALNGGPDGLEQTRRLCTQIGEKIRPGGSLLLEIGQGQSKAVTALLNHHLPHAAIEVISDLSGIERVVSLSLPTD